MQLDDMTSEQAFAALLWQRELGVRDALSDRPFNRYEAQPKPRAPQDLTKPAAAEPATRGEKPAKEAPGLSDHVSTASQLAGQAGSLAELQQAIARFEGCELKKGARNLVFADGNPEARLMIIGEAPGREEDLEGRPFVGSAGQLLDRMFGAINLVRTAQDAENAIYITNVLPWRPPQNRNPLPEEVAMMLPFLKRHVALADPDFLVLMGNVACEALLGRSGITRMRGNWVEVAGKPALPMFHPAYLLRRPEQKRLAWDDLKALRAKMGGQR